MSNNIEKLKTFKIKIIGNYKLGKYESIDPFGSIYLKNYKKWEDIKNNKIYFNKLDLDFVSPFEKLKILLSESLEKKNYIIIKLDSENSSVSFYLNTLPNLVTENLIELSITNYDYIGSSGNLNYDDSFVMSLIINDPSKEINIVKTNTTTIPSSDSNVFSLKTKPVKPIGEMEKKIVYAKNPDTPPEVADFNPIPIKKYNNAALSETQDTNRIKILYPIERGWNIYQIITIVLVVLLVLYFIRNENENQFPFFKKL